MDKIRAILLSIVNECNECALKGERGMCQTSPPEDMREKCVDKALSEIEKEIQALALVAENERLRDAVQDRIDNCPECNGIQYYTDEDNFGLREIL